MRRRTDGIRLGTFRELIVINSEGHVKGIFWSQDPYRARYFAKLIRSLGFRVSIRRPQGAESWEKDKHINYVIGNWRQI